MYRKRHRLPICYFDKRANMGIQMIQLRLLSKNLKIWSIKEWRVVTFHCSKSKFVIDIKNLKVKFEDNNIQPKCQLLM